MRGGGRAAPAAWALATALGLPGAGVHGQPGGRDMPALEGLRPLGEIPVLATPAVVRSASRIEAEPRAGSRRNRPAVPPRSPSRSRSR